MNVKSETKPHKDLQGADLQKAEQDVSTFIDKGFHNWHEAIKQQGKGWRLPTIFELIDLGWEGFWSSSPVAGNASLAWNVNFNYGSDFADFKTNGTNLVRLIRGEPSEQEPVTLEEVEQYKNKSRTKGEKP